MTNLNSTTLWSFYASFISINLNTFLIVFFCLLMSVQSFVILQLLDMYTKNRQQQIKTKIRSKKKECIINSHKSCSRTLRKMYQ